MLDIFLIKYLIIKKVTLVPIDSAYMIVSVRKPFYFNELLFDDKIVTSLNEYECFLSFFFEITNFSKHLIHSGIEVTSFQSVRM